MLTEVETKVIDIDVEGEEEACLVGRLVTDQNWNPLCLIEAMKEAWKPNHGVSALEWGEKLILFRFNNAIDRDWVLKNQPWQFEGSLFAIQKFTGGNEQQSNVTVDHASFGARLYDVPISSVNESSLRLFVKHIGGVLESVDRTDEDSIAKFIRFKMFMDITKPLVRGITIRMKGEILWLPLKYEELPIYCFRCGTIGHCRKNCHSPSRNMKYGSGLNAPQLERRSSKKPITLPCDIIENILSRLPVKSLHRFKVVSKLWKDKISDPRFAEEHLQQFKNSSSRNLLAWEVDELNGYIVGEIQNNEIKVVSAIKHEWGEHMGGQIFCYCDGLYVKLNEKETYEEEMTYVVWNPCNRTYRKFQSPYTIDHQLCGLCYNPLMKDYKVVLADMEHYAVFSCRNNTWSDMKDFYLDDEKLLPSTGVPFNGSFYWILNNIAGDEGFVEFEIIYFDSRDESLQKFHWPNCIEQAYWYDLACFRGHLCLFINLDYGMRIMKIVEGNEGDSWMEMRTEFPYPGSCSQLRPTCCINENEIILEDPDIPRRGYVLYDLIEDAFREIRKNRILKHIVPVPYLENLFLL